MLNEKQLQELLEDNGFTVRIGEDVVEIESCTNAGVNMLLYYSIATWKYDFMDYISKFDPEDELMVYLNDGQYMKDIGIRKGLKDFDAYHDKLLKLNDAILKGGQGLSEKQLQELLKEYNKQYDLLYSEEGNGYQVAGSRDALEYFNSYMTDRDREILQAFSRYRMDLITSDREISAFIFALDNLNLLDVEEGI